MRFYIVEDDIGAPVACELTRAEADARAAELAPYGHTIKLVDVPVTTESIRRLLAGEGGYATEYRIIYPRSQEI